MQFIKKYWKMREQIQSLYHNSRGRSKGQSRTYQAILFLDEKFGSDSIATENLQDLMEFNLIRNEKVL